MAGKAPEWALNSAQWIRTALTDVYHAIGQAEEGKNARLVARYKLISRALSKQEKVLREKYGVPAMTGKGRKMRAD